MLPPDVSAHPESPAGETSLKADKANPSCVWLFPVLLNGVDIFYYYYFLCFCENYTMSFTCDVSMQSQVFAAGVSEHFEEKAEHFWEPFSRAFPRWMTWAWRVVVVQAVCCWPTQDENWSRNEGLCSVTHPLKCSAHQCDPDTITILQCLKTDKT